jgi:hypothetical protein
MQESTSSRKFVTIGKEKNEQDVWFNKIFGVIAALSFKNGKQKITSNHITFKQWNNDIQRYRSLDPGFADQQRGFHDENHKNQSAKVLPLLFQKTTFRSFYS